MSEELGFDIRTALPWFPHERDAPYVMVRVDGAHARAWAAALGVAVRRCYISDTALDANAARLNVARADIVAAKLPDAGSTMSGDFGEILVFLYQAAKEHPRRPIGPKKWRLKQNRTKPAPYSDVVHFVLPSWPTPSAQDELICSEVKTKATGGSSLPIKEAIEDSAKDRTSRLAKTLAWLKERALAEDLGSVTIPHLDRFINATDHPAATKRFRAVAVICSSLVEGELDEAPAELPTGYSVIVITVPELQQVYSRVYAAAHESVAVAATAPVPVTGGLR